MNRFLAGVGKALLFKGNSLIGVANTLTDSNRLLNSSKLHKLELEK